MPYPFAESLFWVAVGACAVAQVAIVRGVIDIGAREGDGQHGAPGTSIVGGRKTARAAGEVVWALIPGVVLALVFAWTWHTIHPAGPSARPQDPATVTVPNPGA